MRPVNDNRGQHWPYIVAGAGCCAFLVGITLFAWGIAKHGELPRLPMEMRP